MKRFSIIHVVGKCMYMCTFISEVIPSQEVGDSSFSSCLPFQARVEELAAMLNAKVVSSYSPEGEQHTAYRAAG